MPSEPIDWKRPVELNDGTPLTVVDAGDTYHVGIRTSEKHPAFPIDRTRGSARRDSGLVISNHKYTVRNVSRSVERIDLSDRPRGGFTCHSDGAPFEKIEFDPELTIADGYQSGLAIGLAGQFYSAGGPGMPEHRTPGNRCRHLRQHDEIELRKNQAWKLGWAAGQARAMDKKPFDNSPGARFRVLLRDGTRLPATMSAITPGKNTDRRYTFDIKGGGTVTTDHFGSAGQGHYDYVVENVPMSNIEIGSLVKPRDGSSAATLLGKNKKFRVVATRGGDNHQLVPEGDFGSPPKTEIMVRADDLWLVDERADGKLRRIAYGIFGQHHTSLFETLGEVSERWWQTRDASRGTKQLGGEFIMEITQERPNQHSMWETVSTSGPIEPLPEAKVVYQRIVGGKVSSVYDDNLTAARGVKGDAQVVRVTSVGGKVTEVELLS